VLLNLLHTSEYDSKPLACTNGAAFIGLLELLAVLALAAAGFGVLRHCTLAIAADWRQRLRETFSLSLDFGVSAVH
jgi:hypothetical protein